MKRANVYKNFWYFFKNGSANSSSAITRYDPYKRAANADTLSLIRDQNKNQMIQMTRVS